MEVSQFNVHREVDGQHWLFNTFSDAQVVLDRDAWAAFQNLGSAQRTGRLMRPQIMQQLLEMGFLVPSRSEELKAVDDWFGRMKSQTEEVHLTILTTLQCNMACPYCMQGDHGEYNAQAKRMEMRTQMELMQWLEAKLDEVQPTTLAVTFFGGEPLLNIPILERAAENLDTICRVRGIKLETAIITNGLLMTRELVEKLVPLGLQSIKVTLDGDEETHDKCRPLRGGQGTFRTIMKNIGEVADLVRVSIGGNFDEETAASYPRLLEELKDQPWAKLLSSVSFKPVIKMAPGVIPLTAVADGGPALGGACQSGTGSASGGCDSCGMLTDTMNDLRRQTRAAGFKTLDGVHMGPCEIHFDQAYTVDPDGYLYACPGFSAEPDKRVGHVSGPNQTPRERITAGKFKHLAPWNNEMCNGCSFIPVCAGGCLVASHNEQGDIELPTCHLSSFEDGATAMAEDAIRKEVA